MVGEPDGIPAGLEFFPEYQSWETAILSVTSSDAKATDATFAKRHAVVAPQPEQPVGTLADETA